MENTLFCPGAGVCVNNVEEKTASQLHCSLHSPTNQHLCGIRGCLTKEARVALECNVCDEQDVP